MAPTDDWWKEQGKNGGTRPDSNSPDKAWDAWNQGRNQRDFDRMVDDYCNPKPDPFKPKQD
jgi:hypothetical protein